MKHLRHLLLAAVCILQVVADDRTMSFNTEVAVLPAPGVMTIDGEWDDWDLSGGVWSYNSPMITDRYSVWTHLMHDGNGIYLLARYHDLTPLQNAASGKDFSVSWRADCYQARVIFDDRTADEHQMHVNMYYSSVDKQPYMIVKHGGFRSKAPYDETGPDRPEQAERWGATMAEAGGAIAFKAWPDGKGYTMEAFWPWSYCRSSGEPLAVGESFVFGTEAMWGNADGTMLSHRLADGIKDDTVNRIFMFRARNGWGRAVMREQGKLELAEQQVALHKARLKHFVDYDTHGSVPIAYDLPEKREVSIVIDNAAGERVRNLFGQYPREAGSVVDNWDCLDDAGNPVAAGTYTASIVHHLPIEMEFYNSAYSSATPPWVTEAGSKLWGANHGHPTSVATRGKVTVLTFTGTEGGSGIQLIDDNGIIQWADQQEFLDATLDDVYAYGLCRSSWQQRVLLARFRLKDGQQVPFEDAARTPNVTLLPDDEVGITGSIAMAEGKLWVCIPERELLRVNPVTGEVEQRYPLGDLVAVTDRDDLLYGLHADGRVTRMDGDGKGSDLFRVGGLAQPMRLGISHDVQRFAISDWSLNQVVVTDASGQRLQAIGSAWSGDDRPAGTFVATNLVQPLGADFDHVGRLWIAEAKKTCKRVTLWSADYELVDQFWGQADYGAMSGFPLTFDATRFVAHGIEFKLDPTPDPWRRKTNEQPLAYHPELAHERGLVYRHNGHEYACGAPGFNKMDHLSILKRDSNGVFRTVVRLELAGRDSAGSAWVDRNDNGARDDDEVLEGLDIRGLYWANGWVRPDLVILTTDGRQFTPQGYSQGGVPLYDFGAPETVANWIAFADRQGSSGTPIMDLAGNVSNGIVYHTTDGRRGSWPNRYGRHDAPSAQRGVLIAPFRTNGIVEEVPGVGSVVALGGDRGEWFLMTMDGIYLSSLCQDAKGSVTLDESYVGQESFGGFIWRDSESSDVLVQLGGASYRLLKVKNLESCVKESRTLQVTAEAIAAGSQIAQDRQSQSVREPDSLRIARIRRAPTEAAPVMQPQSRPLIEGAVDVRVSEEGNPSRWWRAGLAVHNRDLIVMYQVADPSPWQNGAGSYTHAFTGGDAVDLQLNVPGRGALRLLVAPIAGKATVVYWQTEAAEQHNPMQYQVANNPGNASAFDVVKRLDNATVKVATGFNAYTVLLSIPLAELGLDTALGSQISGIVGVIFSDPSGTNRAARLYWHDKETGLVSDVPSESRLSPKRWGILSVDK